MFSSWMVKVFGSSWKTTFFGATTFVAGMVLAIPAIGAKWPLVPEIAKYVIGASTGGGLLFAKDHNVTGGNTLNTDSNPDPQH